jgi:hypothetical protein
MSYNIIQKNIINSIISFQYNEKEQDIFISQCLFKYLNDLKKQINEIKDNDPITIQTINELVNPYQYLLTNIPNSELSISKVKPDSNIFFEITELFNIACLTDYSKNSCNKFDIGLFTNNNDSIEYFLNIFREDCNDSIMFFDINNINELYIDITDRSIDKKCFDILFFELLDYTQEHIFNLLVYLIIIIKYQKKNGTTILKISYLFYKPMIECIYILSCVFDKIQLIKPITANHICSQFYLVCVNFNGLENLDIINQLENEVEKYYNLINGTNRTNEKFLLSLFPNTSELPYIYLNKIEEINSVFGQQQLEFLGQTINIYKNKLRDEKIEIMKKNHINKCIQWCEKNEFPYNKFIYKEK